MGRILVASMGCLIMAVAVSCASASEDTLSRLLAEHNRNRADKGLSPLVLEQKLCGYAQRHAERMASKGHLVHSSMSSLAMVLGNGNVGENIAWGQDSEGAVCDAWMKSPGHKANIMSKRYNKVGFGVKEDERGRKYWCATFSA
jgi:uncharacterized protein YkwD